MRKIAIVLGLLLFLLIAGLSCFLYSKLPPRSGFVKVSSLTNEVKINFDERGVPEIKGKLIADVLIAQGYVTASERLFQMDLMRRKSQGELSEILGKAALKLDIRMRKFGFSLVAKDGIFKMQDAKKKRLQAYADGVNAYILENHLPWEMQILGYKPRLWLPEDTILVAMNLFEDLNHPDNTTELAYTKLIEKLPIQVVDFLTSEVGFFDATIEESVPLIFKVPFPSATIFSLRDKKTGFNELNYFNDPISYGSNAWAISGKLTKSGFPLLSGDPHLKHTVPNIWYRQHLHSNDVDVRGVTIPGVPGVIIGTNGAMAWSFTNSAVDNVDYVPVEKTEVREELILVKQSDPYHLKVETSEFGPVTENWQNKKLALKWSALDSSILAELDLYEINRSNTIEDLLRAYSNWGGPIQNGLAASRDGHILWAIVGKIPKKRGMDGRKIIQWDEKHRWNGYLPFSENPRIIDPPWGFVASANQRPVRQNSKMFQFGNDWPNSARAFRIVEKLKDNKKYTAFDSYQIQLDVQSPVHIWYKEQLLKSLLKVKKNDIWLSEIEILIKSWDGKLSRDSAAYVFMKHYRLMLHERIVIPYLKDFTLNDLDIIKDRVKPDAMLQELFEHKPRHLLPYPFETYDEFSVEVASKTAKALVKKAEDLSKLRWANTNITNIKHPFSKILPKYLSVFIDFPSVEIDGDSLVPKVNKPESGASMRMTIDLGDTNNSIFNQPGGQSSYFLSKNYKDQFRSWEKGKVEPFEKGATISTLTLSP